MNKSHFYLDSTGNIITATQTAKDNPLLAFTNHVAVLMAFAIIFLVWGLFLNLSMAYKRSKYQQNKFKMWKIVCVSWLSIVVLPFFLILILNNVSHTLITQKVALQIPFMAIAVFLLLQVIALVSGTANSFKVKS